MSYDAMHQNQGSICLCWLISTHLLQMLERFVLQYISLDHCFHDCCCNSHNCCSFRDCCCNFHDCCSFCDCCCCFVSFIIRFLYDHRYRRTCSHHQID